MKDRIFAIDATKAFAIFCIVVAHNDYGWLGSYLYSFHIPIFFFISGLFFNCEKENDFIFFVKKRAKNLLIPYFSIAALLYIFWFFVGRKFGASGELNLSVFKNLLGIFYAQGGIEYMDWGVPLWFLPCLFLTSISFYFIAKLKKNILIFLLISLIFLAFITDSYLTFRLFWSFDLVFTSLFFYGFGYLFRPTYFQYILQNKNTPKKIIFAAIMLIINILFFLQNGKIDISKSIYHNILFMFISGLSGSIFYLIIFSFLPKIKWLSYIGENSLLIMGFHLSALTFIKFWVIIIFNQSIDFNTFESIVLALLQILLLFPVIWFINRYLPFIAGKKSKNTYFKKKIFNDKE